MDPLYKYGSMGYIKVLIWTCCYCGLWSLRAQPATTTSPIESERAGLVEYMEGIYFSRKKDYTRAIEAFDKAEGGLASPDRLYYLRGIAYYELGRYKEAIRDYQRDHLLVPGRAAFKIAGTFATLGAVSSSLKWLDTARHYKIRHSREFIFHEPSFQRARFNRKFRGKLRNQSSSRAERYARLAQRRLSRKDYAGTLEYLDKALTYQPGIPEWLQLQAHIYRQLGEYSKEREYYFEEAAYRPFDKAEVFEDIAFSYYAQGDTENAIVWLHQAVEADASFTARQIDIAEIYMTTGRPWQAVEALEAYLDRVPMDHYAYFALALLTLDKEKKRGYIATAIRLCLEQGGTVPEEYKRMER